MRLRHNPGTKSSCLRAGVTPDKGLGIMLTDILPIIIGFVVTALLVKALEPLAWKLGWLDKPCSRKQHDGAVPLTGGVAILGGFLVAIWMTGTIPTRWPLLASMVLLCGVGLVDDLIHLTAKFRLLMQGAAALAMCLLKGLSLSHLGNLFGLGPVIIANPIVAYTFTVFCIMGVINAINMIDGVDGLSGGLILIALVWVAFLASTSGRDVMPQLALVGCVGGYLLYNMRGPIREKAKVFMGDSGSTILGLGLAWFMIRNSAPMAREVQAFPPILAPWLIAIPLLDTVSLMIKRGLKGGDPFKADRDHLHHILQRAGLSDRCTTVVILFISLVVSAAAVLGWYWLQLPEPVLFYGFVGMFAVYYWLVHHSDGLVRIMSHLLHSESTPSSLMACVDPEPANHPPLKSAS